MVRRVDARIGACSVTLDCTAKSVAEQPGVLPQRLPRGEFRMPRAFGHWHLPSGCTLPITRAYARVTRRTLPRLRPVGTVGGRGYGRAVNYQRGANR